jgi:branched-chain amino acid transport system permease protein
VPSLNLVIIQLFHGLVLGGMLALVSSGLTIILGTLGLVNFAHAALFTFGAYAGLMVFESTHSFVLALIAGAVITCLLGILLERLLIRRFYLRPHEDQILMTFGLGIVIVEALRAGFGGLGRTMPTPAWGSGIVRMADLVYPLYRLEIFIIAAIALLIFYLVLFHSRLGLIVRAAIEDTTMVRILGLRASRIRMIVFGVGVLAAGLAGIVLGPILSIYPDMGLRFMVQSFVVVVIGGLGSFVGAIVGGFIAGEILTMTALFNTAYSDAMLFVAMVAILVFRPRGLFGTEGRL